MATTTTHDAVNYPHLLKMVGDVINNDTTLNRGAVRTALFSNTNPVGNLTGKVDFVICFNCTGGAPNWDSEDHSAGFAPRPLRGIVQIHQINLANDSQLDRMGPLFSLLLQEMGHYWIRGNAGQAKIRTDAGDVDTPTAANIVAALNGGGGYPPFPMMGRQDAHWSPFFDGVNSPFEAGKFGPELETEGVGFFGLSGRYTQVEGQARVGPDLFLPSSDGGIVTTTAAYCFFERWLMGDWTPPKLSSVGTVWPTFRVIEPIWAFPLPFQAGLFVELQSGERLYIGYHQGPHQLGVYQTNGGYIGASVSLPTDPYRPHEVIGLRAVQVGTTIRFQARVWPVQTGCLGAGLGWPFRFKPNPTGSWVLGDLDGNLVDPGGGATDPYIGWRTIGTRTGRLTRVGLSSRSLQTGGSAGNRTYGMAYTRLGARLYVLDTGVVRQVDVGTLAEDIPKAGPVRLANGSLMMPYRLSGGADATYAEDELLQEAPKWTIAAPNGDFAFGGAVTLESCALVSWAGGLAPGKKLVGPMKRVKFNDFLLPADPLRLRRIEPPFNGAYKVLFCAVSRTDPEIDNLKLTQLDRIRRAFQIYYAAVTARAIDTTIS